MSCINMLNASTTKQLFGKTHGWDVMDGTYKVYWMVFKLVKVY